MSILLISKDSMIPIGNPEDFAIISAETSKIIRYLYPFENFKFTFQISILLKWMKINWYIFQSSQVLFHLEA